MSRSIRTILDSTLRSHFDLLYRPKRLFGKSPETSRLYEFTFNYFSKFLQHDPLLADLTDESVMACMEWIVRQGLSPRTANKTRDQLCSLWRFLARKGIVGQWPEVPSLPEPRRTPIGWDRSELRRLWDMCENQRGFVAGVPANLWWLGIHSVAWDSLERIGAVRYLRKDCCLCNFQWAYFPAETRKGRREDFTAKIHPTTAVILREVVQYAVESPFVFPWDRAKEYLHTRYKNLRRKAGLNTDRWHSFHCIRKTGASFAEAAGIDAGRLLGHAPGSRVTHEHYIDPKLSGQTQACDVLFRPGDPDPHPPKAA